VEVDGTGDVVGEEGMRVLPAVYYYQTGIFQMCFEPFRGDPFDHAFIRAFWIGLFHIECRNNALFHGNGYRLRIVEDNSL